MKKLLFSSCLFLLNISYSFGQDVKVTSSFDTSTIYIGDQIKFTITVDQPADLRLSLPSLKDTIIKNIEILSGPLVDSSSMQNGRIKIIANYLITSFDSGFYQVPPVFAEMRNENGMKRFYSDYSQLEVIRVKIAPADTVARIFDIVDPYRAPVTIGEVLPWVLIFTIIGTFIWFAIRYIREHKKSGYDAEKVVNPDPAHVIAFRELEKLKEDKLWQKGDIKIYYTRLTEILRLYLENRFSVFSLELTTSETLETLLKTGFKQDGAYNLLETVLTTADMVKFAKHNPEPSEHESLFQDSWNFVVDTKEETVISEQVDINNQKGERNL